MRKPRPQPNIHFRIDAQGYSLVAQHQRQVIRDTADCIEAGDSFDAMRPEVVAVLRARAEQPWRGQPPKGAPPSREPERAEIRAAADRIEAGDSFDVAVVTKALRAWANSLKPSPPPELGKPSKVNPADIALEWMSQKRRAVPDLKLRSELAAKYDVDESTIAYAVAMYGDAPERLLRKLVDEFGARWKK